MQLDMFSQAPARTALDDGIQDLRLDIYRYVAVTDAAYRTVVSSDALDLLGKVQEAGGCCDFAKKALPFALVQELRRHKLATFTYEGKRVRVRLNEQRIIELSEEAAERTEMFIS